MQCSDWPSWACTTTFGTKGQVQRKYEAESKEKTKIVISDNLSPKEIGMDARQVKNSRYLLQVNLGQ